MISKTKKPFLKTLLKALNDLAMPVVAAFAVLFSILPWFEPKEGTNTRQEHIVLAVCLWTVFAAVKLLNWWLKKKDPNYSNYELKLSRRLELSNLVPLLVLTVIVVFPFYLLFVTSVKNNFEAMSITFSWWPKEGIDFGAYEYLFELEELVGYDVVRSFINSIIYATVPTVGGLISSSLAAYAFSKLNFRFKGLMYATLIATIMMPGCVTLATSYMLFEVYGWTNSPLPLIIPGLFGSAGCVMFLREFFMGIPNGLLEAAEMDGAGVWRRYFYIMLPLAKPALTAQFILGFIAGFNDYLGPMLYLNEVESYPIQIFISTLDGDPAIASMLNVIASAGVCALVPMLILYILFQKTILSGISISSGLKG